ncbi:adenylosuccinate lyase [Aestuariivivens marinum]|uniref:adenylosuccinate lyase n=1 Tax=Aestuariivivens marinum TaxID=2913555 RepID=UPI001F59F8ED|nr:adenylosuccinate lyase [Aestuariivivens marinum]
MTSTGLYKELNYVNASRQNRLRYARLVLNNLSLLPELIDILCMVNDKNSCRAAWILEFVCIDNIYSITPHLNKFTNNLKHIYLDSAVRPVSKICCLIAKAYCLQTSNPIKDVLTQIHKELIIEACFDWMISNHKVAAKVHAMETLFLFGHENNTWIHNELAIILQREFYEQSAGYKSRAKGILKRIKK